MSYSTKSLLRDYQSIPIPQYYNLEKDSYEPMLGSEGLILVNTMQSKFRDDFPGSLLNENYWEVVSLGSGMSIQVASSELRISAGTTANSETIIMSKATYSIPFRVMFIAYLSQRIADQEFYLEIRSTDNTDYAIWKFDGTSATTGKVNVGNQSRDGTESTHTITSTNSYTVFEIELFPDEVYFHQRNADSTSARSYSFVRTRFIPDPNKQYRIVIRVKNLSTLPASNTIFYIDSVSVQDIKELSAEITAGRGLVAGSQAVSVWSAGGSVSISNSPTVYSIQNGIFNVDTTTNLSENLAFTGTSRDVGSPVARDILRVVVRHIAGNNIGHLIVEQSNDNSTWRETHRLPIPSIDKHILVDFPVAMRYVRVKFQNGTTAQTGFFLSTDIIANSYCYIPLSLNFLLTTTLLGANATYTSDVFNMGPNPLYKQAMILVYADQLGTLYFDQSGDGSTFRTTNTQSVSAGTTLVLTYPIVAQYFRVRYTNGATAQSLFELQLTLV